MRSLRAQYFQSAERCSCEPSPCQPTRSRRRQEVAVVRHPIADARNVVVGYELRFGGSIDLGDPAMDAKATSALLVEAFGDIGLETLAGRHPAWVTIARNFLVEIGPPPVRPDRAVLQIKAYHARDDLLADPPEALAQRLHDRARRVGGRDGRQRRGAHVAVLDRAGRRRQASSIEELPRVLRVPKMQGALLVATDVGDHAAFERCKALGFTYFQGEYFAQPRTFSTAASRPPASARCAGSPSCTAGDVSFEDLERIISSDVGLSLKLLRYVN